MRAFTLLTIPAAAVLAFAPIEHAAAPQDPPTVSQSLYPTNTTGLSSTMSSSSLTSTIAGNLSTTKTTSSTTAESQSVVLVTTSQSNSAETITSFVAASTSTSATVTSATGITQPGAATKVGNSAFGALALAVGVGAYFM